jgi:hypothetical protein
MAFLEEQNRQLRDTVQKLYEHVRAGHSLPALPESSTGEDRPLLHDIVAYVRTLPMGVTSRHEQVQCQIPGPDAAAAVSFSQPQPEASPYPDFAAAATQLNTITASSMQQDPLLHPHALAASALHTPLNCHPTLTPVSLSTGFSSTALALVSMTSRSLPTKTAGLVSYKH